ncbi:A disintegrin and metalloproteinase with thrombospondin motifs 2 [Merluccius polli]|uniref:A disintegrin and metalloproteinase with thrombospondin motifs 2 n=1 Tax=Merluccius polli TaxID=89951 RepID=A0AA47NSP0_MERPO|nr:A disintegrin and metalloproteinase with thrombospondin motifs 2 [Merluccius polli]
MLNPRPPDSRPANGGRTCMGSIYQFQMCSTDECDDIYSDSREEQCRAQGPNFEFHNNKHHWLPYEHIDREYTRFEVQAKPCNFSANKRCHLHCKSKETRDVVYMQRVVLDGTRCSYKDPHSVCVRGECEKVGCDGVVGSSKQEDKCGVCEGDNSSCKTFKDTINRIAKKQGFLKVLEIPRGARHLLIQELKATAHILVVKNVASGMFFLNGENDYPESRSVIEKGVEWEYGNDNDKETLQTNGPLTHGVLIMMQLHGDEDVNLSYKYMMSVDMDSAIQDNMLVEDSAYEWAPKRWSYCSKQCGGGRATHSSMYIHPFAHPVVESKQYLRYGCRRRADSKMVHKTFCNKSNMKPRGDIRDCNQKPCPPPIWVTGEWQNCSKSCGKTGQQLRSVSCVQPSDNNTTRSIHSKHCNDDRPEARRGCNRHPCPAQWRVGPWSQCSVTCGNGTQQRQALCHTRDNTIGLCLDSKPDTIRVCRLDPCPKGSSDLNKNGNILIQWLSRPNPDFPVQKISSRLAPVGPVTPPPRTSACAHASRRHRREETGQRCHGDRTVFCRMDVLKRYCSLPSYQRMCCKSCSNVTIIEPISTASSTPNTSVQPTVITDHPTISPGIVFSTSTIMTTTPTPTTTTTTTMSTIPSSTSNTLTTTPTPTPPPYVSPTTTLAPVTSAHISPTQGATSLPPIATSMPTIPGTVSPSMASSSPTFMTSSPVQHSPCLRQMFRICPTHLPPLTSTHTATELVPRSTAQRKHIQRRNLRQIPGNKKALSPETKLKKHGVPKTKTKKVIPAKAKPKKTILPKNVTKERPMTTPKKNTPQKDVPPKVNPKKTEPKTKLTKTAQPKKSTKSKTKVVTKKEGPKKIPEEKKKNPKKNTSTTPSYDDTTPMNPASSEDGRFSTSSFSITPSATAASVPSPRSTVNVTIVPNVTDTASEHPLWYDDHRERPLETATPSMLHSDGMATAPAGTAYFDDVAMPSGTMPTAFRDADDAAVASGTLLYADDTITVQMPYGDVAVGTSGTAVLEEDLTGSIPTIHNDDVVAGLTTSPWGDLSEEYIPVRVPLVPVTAAPPVITTAAATTATTTTTTTTTTTAKRRTSRRPTAVPLGGAEENNSVDDVQYNRIVGVDIGDVSRNNQIGRRRVNLRERTKNKRIQELLAEKRNFLLRMKRGQAA